MADLPRIFAQPSIAFSPLPVAQPTQHFQQLAHVTAGLAYQFQQIDNAAVEAESRRVSAETKASIEDTIAQGKMSITDPDEYHSTVSSKSAEIYKTTLDGIKDERVRYNVESSLSPYLIKAKTQVDLDRHEKRVQKAEGDSIIYLDGASKRIGKMDDPLEIAKETADVNKHLDMMISTGAMTPKAGETARIKVRDDAVKERISWLTLTNPEKLLLEIRDPNKFLTISGPERVALEQHALEAIRERRMADQRAIQERIDKQHDSYLQATQAPNASLAVIRQQVVDDTTLNWQTREHMLDRIDRSIEAKNKGELDPFTHTDGNVYNSIAQDMYKNPDKWSPSRLHEYTGRGISIAHTNQLKDDLAKIQKGENVNSDQKQAVLHAMERYRHNQFFLDKPLRKGKDTPVENILLNDMRSQKILDQVWARANGPQKENPMVVLQELMVPYEEARVKSYFDSFKETASDLGLIPESWRPTLAGISDQEILAARQLLVKRGQEATPESIKTVVQNERARKRTPGAMPPAAAPGFSVNAPGSVLAATAAQQPEAPMVRTEPGAPKQAMGGQIPYLNEVSDFYRQRFNRTLPVSAAGQSATHDAMGFEHSKSFDVAVHPQSAEGLALMDYLDSKRIHFIAFTGAVAGQATGPHIHVGAPSKRKAPAVANAETKPVY